MKITNEAAARLKSDFPLLANSGIIYLDSAATAQKPKSVLNTVDQFARQRYAAVHRGLYPLASTATQEYEAARKAIANFINAKHDEIIFTHGTTDSLNGLSHSIQAVLPAGKKKILLTELEHHANLIPWQQFAKRHGYTLDYLPITKQFTLDLSTLKSKLAAGDVALLCIAHVSNVVGTINPIAQICKLAKAAGVITVVDGAQAIAHLPVDVAELDCDFYAFSGHKLYGPTGVGVLYARSSLLEKLPPFYFGGNMIESVSKFDAHWAKIPDRFEAGTPPIVEVIGLAAAVKYLSEIGLDDIHTHEAALFEYAKQQLTIHELAGNVTIFAGEPNAGIISFTMRGIHAHDIASIVGEHKVCLRAGHHCAMPLTQVLGVPATARISFGLYNSTHDIDAFILALKKAKSMFEESGKSRSGRGSR